MLIFSKRHYSHSANAKLYCDIDNHVVIQVITFLGVLPIIKKLLDFYNYMLNTGYMGLNILKRYFSYSFHSISTTFYHTCYGNRGTFTFGGDLLNINKMMTLPIFF